MRDTGATLDFLSPLSLVPGMGPKRLAAMQESGIETIGDYLYRFPLRYIDRSTVTPIRDTERFINQTCTISGVVETISLEQGKRVRLRALLNDGTGSIELVWFQGVSFYRQSVKKKIRIIASGKISFFHHVQMVHPEIEILSNESSVLETPVLPLYGLTTPMRDAGIGRKFRIKTTLWILKNLKHYPAILPDKVEKKHNFPPLATCLREIHFPTHLSELGIFQERIRYEELYKLAVALSFNRKKFLLPGRTLSPGTLKERFIANLPFALTKDQLTAAAILLADCASPRRMHRLLQGDVGSGKTVVACMASLPSLNTGLQVVWMTPTEILAEQTCRKINEWLLPLNFKAEVFSASSRATGNYNDLRKRLSTGEITFVIGTHALLQSLVTFKSVGIFIIDEQHRFGAEQRLTLHGKDAAADFLLMSATPIPQTLAGTLYGDLDPVIIKTLLPGRQPVATHIVPKNKRNDMEQFIAKELVSGSQCYHIVPRIENEELTDETIPAPTDLATAYKKITSGPLSRFPATCIHGKLSAGEKERILARWYAKETSILVATTIIEVGIDLPDATIIVIENSDRFGLAQLHQLRGRVGRGTKKSYCFLMCDDATNCEATNRLQSFCKEHDGFAVAELDLKNRGPGEVNGYRQSGWENLVMADIIRDSKLFAEIRNDVGKQILG